MPNTKLAPEVEKFLNKHHFFDYQETSRYSNLLEKQVAERLDLGNPLNLIIPVPNQIKNNPKPFLVLDLGGTYLRVCLCQSSADKVKILAEEKSFFYKKKLYTPENLNEDIIAAIKHFVQTNQDLLSTEEIDQVIFSFGNALQPTYKAGKLDGKILYWGKNHQQKGLLGYQLGTGLQKQLSQNGFPKATVQLINDGALSALAGLPTTQSGDCLLSLIVGTGTNINVGFRLAENLYLANLEFGDFEFIPYSNFDEQLNVKVVTPNHFRTEKLFSGAWQNLLFLTMLEFAVKDKLLSSTDSFEKISKLTSGELEEIFAEKFQADNPLSLNENEWKIYHSLWKQIIRRGAFICAYAVLHLALLMKKLGYLSNNLILVPSGALLEHSHPFKQKFQTILEEQLSTIPELNDTKIQTFKPEKIIYQAASVLNNLITSD